MLSPCKNGMGFVDPYRSILDSKTIDERFSTSDDLIDWFHGELNQGLSNERASLLFYHMTLFAGHRSSTYDGRDRFRMNQTVREAFRKWIAEDFAPSEAVSPLIVSNFYTVHESLQMRASMPFQKYMEKAVMSFSNYLTFVQAVKVLAYYAEVGLPMRVDLFDAMADVIYKSKDQIEPPFAAAILQSISRLDAVHGQGYCYKRYNTTEVFDALYPVADGKLPTPAKQKALHRVASWFNVAVDPENYPLEVCERVISGDLEQAFSPLAGDGLTVTFRRQMVVGLNSEGSLATCAHQGRTAELFVDSLSLFVGECVQGRRGQAMYAGGKLLLHSAFIQRAAPDTVFLRMPRQLVFKMSNYALQEQVAWGVRHLDAGVWCFGKNEQWVHPQELTFFR
jgi:hypothetical protein